MLLNKFLKILTDPSDYAGGKQLLQSSSIISYSEKKELENIYEIEAKVNKNSVISDIQLYINPQAEYLSQFNCRCYYYATCSHIVAVALKFLSSHKKEDFHITTKPQKYNYKVYELNKEFYFSADYEPELFSWIKSSSEYSEKIKVFFDKMAYYERDLVYEAKLSKTFKLSPAIIRSLSHLKILETKLVIEPSKYKVAVKNKKIFVESLCTTKLDYKKGILTTCIDDEKLLAENNIDISPEFLFDRLPEYMKRDSIQLSKEIENFRLGEIPAKYRLNFFEEDKKIFVSPEIIFKGNSYKGNDILKIDTKYHKVSDIEWEKINETEYRNFISYLKTKNLIFRNTSFLCLPDFFKNEYQKIHKNWDITGLKNITITGTADLDISDKKSSINIVYNLKDYKLSREDIESIKTNGFIKRDNKLYLVENKDELIANTNIENTKENLLCYLETIKTKENLSINNPVIENIKIPPKFDKILRNYQKDGFKWMFFLHKFKFGGILADDMGLGKTIQTLSLIESIKEKGQFLIMVPKSLLFNWHEEIKKFLKTDDFVIYDGERKKREQIFPELTKKKIILTSYSIFKKDFALFKELEFLYIILDEAQHIKNSETIIWHHVKELKTGSRLALTGTPVENSIKELWSIFEFIMPGYLGKYDTYLLPGGIDELKYRTMPFLLRRTKKEVLTELPEKIEQVLKIEMHPQQEKLYYSILEDVKKKLYEEIEHFGIKKSYFTILSALTYLREVCNHPELIGKPEIGSAKIELFEELIVDAVEGGHKVLVFSQFVKMLDIMKRSLEHKKIKYEYLSGQTKNRMEAVKNFNENSDIKVFLISLKAGGVGLNLTSADTVIHIDPWWNPMVENQATDRAYRIGQTRNLNVYKIITQGTIEEKILDIQERKKELFDAIVNSNAEFLKEITIEDLKKLLE